MTVANSASYLAEMAIEEEGTAGTAGTTPDIYDYFNGDPGINPVQTVVRMENVYNRALLKTAFGAYHMEGSVPQYVEPGGTLGWLMKWALGGVSSSQQGATDAYKHTFIPANATKTFTLWLVRGGNQTVKIPYCKVNTIEFTQSVDDALRMNWSFIGQKETIAADFGTHSYSTLNPFMNSNLTVEINDGATGVAAEVHNTTITLENNINIDSGRVHGSRFYSNLINGKRSISGSFDLWFDDDTQYESFWGDRSTPATTPETDAPETNKLEFTWDTGIEAATSYNYIFKITVPAAVYESTSVDLGGDRIKQTVNFVGQYDTSATNEVSAELTNKTTDYAI